jgi:cupin 2 domain-containing protein
MRLSNIFESVPGGMRAEVFEEIVRSPNVRIERIISKGHTSPDIGWYDQDENEWVMVIDGHATIEFEDGTLVTLGKGDHLNIPAHCKHKVSWSDPNHITIWLAVFYG